MTMMHTIMFLILPYVGKPKLSQAEYAKGWTLGGLDAIEYGDV